MPSLGQMQADIAAERTNAAPPAVPAQGTPANTAPSGAMPSLEQMQADIAAHQSGGGGFMNTELSPLPGVTGSITPRKIAQGAQDNLPVLGAVAGGLLGGPAGAMGGAIGGQAIKEAIEQGFQGINRSGMDTAKNLAMQGAVAGGAELLSPPALKGARAVAPKVGEALTSIPAPVIKAYLDGQMPVQSLLSAAGGKLSAATEVVQQKILGKIDSAQSEMEKPALQVLGARATGQSDAEVGANIKSTLVKDIQARYGPFAEAYDKMDTVNQSIAIADESRRSLTQGMKDWALENHPESSDTYKMIQKHAQNIDASNTGAQLQGAASDLKADLSQAYKDGNTKRIEALTEVRDRLTDFTEKQVTDLAKRVGKGTATPEELASFRKIADSEGVPQEEDVAQYAKNIAKDYLNSVDKVSKDYSGFKDYINFIQQQTGAKKAMGPGTLVKAIQSIPDEKLAAKMFTPNNVAALSRLKTETPEIFQQLAGVEVRDMGVAATKDGALNMDKFLKSVNEMPKEVRNLVFSQEEQQAMSSVANNQKLQMLKETAKAAKGHILGASGESHILSIGEGKDTRAAQDLGKLSNLTGENLIREVQQLTDASNYIKAQDQIGGASAGQMGKSIAMQTAAGAGAGTVLGHAGESIGVGQLPALGGAIGAARAIGTSPYALKLGLDTLNSKYAPAITRGVMQEGAQTLGNAVMHGSGAVNALRKPGQ